MTFTSKVRYRITQFLAQETAGGIVMMTAAALALLLSNSPLSSVYTQTFNSPLYDSLTLKMMIADGLMVIFFFAVGMELKREIQEGVLQDRSQLLLPLGAALGGMAVPALIFLGVNASSPDYWVGWAIPSATDIAFALCVLQLVGPRIPTTLKVFLLAVAIFDDLGAIIIIALFYGGPLNSVGLLGALIIVLALYALHSYKVSIIPLYALLGGALAYFLHLGGIHSTIGGVITAFFVPQQYLHSTLQRLQPYVSFGILPVFALSAAGITLLGLSLDDFTTPITLGILLGLFVGKQIGVFGVAWALIKSGFVNLPHGVRLPHLYGASMLTGIGFTMSLFIGFLAFNTPYTIDHMKLGVFTGSLCSALLGWSYLRWTLKKDSD